MKDLTRIAHEVDQIAGRIDGLRSDLMETLQEDDVHPDRDAEEISRLRLEIQHCHTRLMSLSSLISA